MVVEVINTGTELLLGEILNTNFQYLSKHLNSMGFDVLYQTTVGDNKNRMQEAVTHAMQRADIVIITGGLGPTRGDITKDTVTEICGLECYLDLDTWGRIDAFFAKKGSCPPPNNDKQAMIPLGAEVLQNDMGTAPGLFISHQDKYLILLPGPPGELTDMCEKQLWPLLRQRFGNLGIILSRTLHLRGIGESLTAEKIDDLVTQQTNPTIAIYARRGEILIRITAKADSSKLAISMLDKAEVALRERLAAYIYGTDDDSLPSIAGKILSANHQTVAFAESCTGGLASSLITDIPGSSEYLLGSVVTYTNMAKHKLINVQQQTLDEFGAVSREAACEMAVGVRSLMGSDYGVSITGNAGPGESENKPVGLVYIAVATKQAVYCQEHRFPYGRVENKLRIALTAISMLLDKINQENNSEDKI